MPSADLRQSLRTGQARQVVEISIDGFVSLYRTHRELSDPRQAADSRQVSGARVAGAGFAWSRLAFLTSSGESAR